MGDYISSSNEAISEFVTKIRFLKEENQNLRDENEVIDHRLFEVSKIRDIIQVKLSKAEKRATFEKEISEGLKIQLRELKDENSLMGKDIEMLKFI